MQGSCAPSGEIIAVLFAPITAPGPRSTPKRRECRGHDFERNIALQFGAARAKWHEHLVGTQDGFGAGRHVLPILYQLKGEVLLL